MCERLQGLLPIGLHADLILNRLKCDRALRELRGSEEQETEDAPDDSGSSGNREQSPAEQRQDIEARLRELARRQLIIDQNRLARPK